MSKATHDELGELHAVYAKLLARFLNQKYFDEEGNEVPPPATILREARQFLKDNSIEATAAPGSDAEAVLNGLVPFTEIATQPKREH